MTEQLTVDPGALAVVVAMSTTTVVVIVVVVLLLLVAAVAIVRVGAIELDRREAAARGTSPVGRDAPASVPGPERPDPTDTFPMAAVDGAAAAVADGPVRYGVSITRRDGEPTRYRVVTSAGTKRAASIAFERDGSPSDRVEDVRVEVLGPVGLGADGTPDMDAGDLFDRSEY